MSDPTTSELSAANLYYIAHNLYITAWGTTRQDVQDLEAPPPFCAVGVVQGSLWGIPLYAKVFQRGVWNA